jgi:hypothetical protein
VRGAAASAASFRAEKAGFSSAFSLANASACAVEVLCRIERISRDAFLFMLVSGTYLAGSF